MILGRFREVSGDGHGKSWDGGNDLHYCDVCHVCEMDSGQHFPVYIPIYEVPDDHAGVNCNLHLCGPCLKDVYAVSNLVLAFYPEIAEYLNEDSDLAATARSVELAFDDLQSIVVIRQYEDYSQIPEQDILPQKNEGSGLSKPRVKVVTIQGRIDDRKPEVVLFEVHAGYAPLTEAPPSLANGRPQVHMRHTKWINLEKYKENAGVQATYEYNLFDTAGFQLLCEWAKVQSREWLMNWHLDTVKRHGLVDLTRI